MNKNMLLEKVDYSKDPEAPITIGSKLLKKIDKEWGKDSDVYEAVEELIIDYGSASPKRLAMALKRVLSNYDMWEAPYKGLVNKIEKWQFVNENVAVLAGNCAAAATAIGAVKGVMAMKEDSDNKGKSIYYRPKDVEKLYNEQKKKGSNISKFEIYVVKAAMWARARSNNYHGYHEKWPAVEYKNGKFYAQTIHDGMTEVPFNYSVMTPEYLGIDEGVGTVVGRVALRAAAGMAARRIAKKFRKNEAVNEVDSNSDYYNEAYNAIDRMVNKYDEYTIKELETYINDGDIPFKDFMEEMGYDPWNLTEDEDSVLCNAISQAIMDYIYDYAHGNVNESKVNESFTNTDPRFIKLIWKVRPLCKKYKNDIVIYYDELDDNYFWDYKDEYDGEGNVVAVARYNANNDDVIMTEK